jgi:flagellar motility protein MotE (MotC chaperone)
MMSDKKTTLILAVGFLIFSLVTVPLDGLWHFGADTVFAADEDKTEDNGSEGKEGGAAAQPCPECPECPDPAKVVLRGLEEKKQAIEAAQKTLNQQKKELETYESQIDEKLAELTAVKNQIKEDMARLTQEKTQQELDADDAYESKMNRLVKMYGGMKPKAAAAIVDKMELEVAQEIFLRMREAVAAQILSYVDSAKAAKISERLAFRKK